MRPEEDFQQLMDEIQQELERVVAATASRPLTDDERQLVCHFSGVKFQREPRC